MKIINKHISIDEDLYNIAVSLGNKRGMRFAPFLVYLINRYVDEQSKIANNNILKERLTSDED